MGDRLGAYELVRQIHRGGACSVWEAVDRASDVRFAIKRVSDLCLHRDGETQLMKNEFDLLKQLNHKNIINVVEHHLSEEACFTVFPLFSEMNLMQAIQNHRQACLYFLEKMVAQLADALSYLHSRGLVHCDIRPKNVLVGAKGDVSLIDFAISAKSKSWLSRLFGGSSKVQGSRPYVSPEQIRGQSLDGSSDIYSFGCMLFEIVTGELPFSASTPIEILSKHLSSPVPSAQSINSNLTDEFDQLIKSMMAKERRDRISSRELVRKLGCVGIWKVPPEKPLPSNADW